MHFGNRTLHPCLVEINDAIIKRWFVCRDGTAMSQRTARKGNSSNSITGSFIDTISEHMWYITSSILIPATTTSCYFNPSLVILICAAQPITCHCRSTCMSAIQHLFTSCYIPHVPRYVINRRPLAVFPQERYKMAITVNGTTDRRW